MVTYNILYCMRVYVCMFVSTWGRATGFQLHPIAPCMTSAVLGGPKVCCVFLVLRRFESVHLFLSSFSTLPDGSPYINEFKCGEHNI